MKIWMAVLALAAAGCASGRNTVTESDRQVILLSRLAAEGAGQIFTEYQATQEKGGPSWTVIGLGLENLEDIRRGMAHLGETYGPPERPLPYTAANVTEAIKGSKDEHAKLTWWHAAGGLLVGVGTWFLRNVGLRAIPGIGPLLARVAPNLTNGAAQNDKIASGLQVVLDEGRKRLDALLGKLAEKIPDAAVKAEIVGAIPDLKEIAVKEMERRGILAANTRLYEANPDTGEATKT